ncbi:MAG: 2-amino-4-hydroxy-6-hydroxymethyldihydropteridine diphosphokinase [Candidatus Omnitrophica bacterium]|nr:2-amino-4-hydroxy-6-hydroxymethyldihydropteridine diphosphokinase [Candidatus Omnitrophota bacterium]
MAIYIGIGANLGDRARSIRNALAMLKTHPEIRVKKVSRLRETSPVDGPAQPDYLNAAAELESSLSPQELLRALQEIEHRLGRVRALKNGPRIIDLDLLLYHEQIICSAGLQVPHPRMTRRAFVMEPLREISPDIDKVIQRIGKVHENTKN